MSSEALATQEGKGGGEAQPSDAGSTAAARIWRRWQPLGAAAGCSASGGGLCVAVRQLQRLCRRGCQLRVRGGGGLGKAVNRGSNAARQHPGAKL